LGYTNNSEVKGGRKHSRVAVDKLLPGETGSEPFAVNIVLFLATDPEARIRFPALPGKKVVGLERGPLSLVSTTEELLDRKVASPV
jgi:hypothetical protein